MEARAAEFPHPSCRLNGLFLARNPWGTRVSADCHPFESSTVTYACGLTCHPSPRSISFESDLLNGEFHEVNDPFKISSLHESDLNPLRILGSVGMNFRISGMDQALAV